MKVIVTVQDPVCGMDIDSHNAAGEATYNGKTYYFCGARCKAKFDAHPEKYTAAKPAPAPAPLPKN